VANQRSENRKPTLKDLLPPDNLEWLIDSAPDGFVITDFQGHIVFTNAPAEKLFGYDEDELIGKPIETLVPHAFREKHAEDRQHYTAQMRTRPMGIGLELYGLRKDGTEFPVEISLSPMQTDRGGLVIAIVRDVTEYKRERQISQTFQNAILSPLPEDLVGLKMASLYKPAHTGTLVGGDFFDVLRIRPGLIAIALGDVSGKGVEAAVHTALAKYSFRAYAYVDPGPAYLMERLNRAVARQSAVDTFITFFYGLLDVEKGTMFCANAGHMPALHMSCGGQQETCPQQVTEVTINGLPLGVLPDTRYEQREIRFRRGDKLLLYSDGVTDARGDEGMYGMANLIEFFRRHGCAEPDDFISSLTETLESWSEGHLQDDITMLMVAMD